jgi:hypothetical protein
MFSNTTYELIVVFLQKWRETDVRYQPTEKKWLLDKLEELIDLYITERTEQ